MSLGEILKQARLEHQWTREDVAAKTHMLTRRIEEMETEQFNKFPAAIYAKGAIKLYCKTLGIDAQPLLDEFVTEDTHTHDHPMAVLRPSIHGLPKKPLEPIHTGAHSVLPSTPGQSQQEPPQSPLTPTRTIHVEPAENTYTSVPIPTRLAESPTPSEQTENTSRQALLASLSTATETTPASTHERPHPLIPHDATPSGAIFAPQHPVEVPANPFLSHLRGLFHTIVSATQNLFKGSHPLTSTNLKLTIIKLLWIFLVLIGLTVIILGFHYVTATSAEAPALDVSVGETSLTLPPVAQPSMPHLK